MLYFDISSVTGHSSPDVTAAVVVQSRIEYNNKKVVNNNNNNEEKGFVIYAPGEEPSNTSEKPDPNSPFSAFHGMRNTWQIQGMENMSTNEYYKAITDRQTQIRVQRMAQEGIRHREPLNDYYESLSRKREESDQQQQQQK